MCWMGRFDAILEQGEDGCSLELLGLSSGTKEDSRAKFC